MRITKLIIIKNKNKQSVVDSQIGGLFYFGRI